MTGDVHVILFSKLNEMIRFIEEENSFYWLNMHTFHAVLRHDGVEMLPDNFDTQTIGSEVVCDIERSADQKIILISIFQ